ncbi:zinc finger BED domain-containing protein 1-like [Oreochromis niloticus]|uniref:zinc finger BED domain-containing protein 1-like n=1 Tax=Oreochromis niloticus TaxID=8128 RepID=UPI0009058A77|nr:zinc finger BED domain-containing protein 1-like [Oreochromis niloticus]
MKDATLVMSEESMPTLSIIAPLHAKLVMGAQESVDDTPTVRDIKTAIAEDLGKRYVNERETLWMASTVDPRFKDLPFLSEAETSETYSRLLDTVVTVIKKEKISKRIRRLTNRWRKRMPQRRLITHISKTALTPSLGHP